MRKRGSRIEAPRPDEVRSLAQMLEQLAEINQRLARSHGMLLKIEPPSGAPEAPTTDRNPDATRKGNAA